jgi:hypothetical protein
LGASVSEVSLYLLQPLHVLEGLELEDIQELGIEAWVVVAE